MVSVGLGVVPLFFARCGAAYQAGEALSSVERAIKTAKSYFAEPTNTRGKIYRVVHRRKAACCYGSTNHIAPTATGAKVWSEINAQDWLCSGVLEYTKPRPPDRRPARRAVPRSLT